MHRIANVAEGSLHPDMLSEKVQYALGNPGCY